MDAQLLGNGPVRVCRTRIVCDADQRVLNAARVCELQLLFAEALELLDGEPVVMQTIPPIAERALGYREHQGFGLVRASPADPAGLAHWKRGDECRLEPDVVAVIQVIDGDVAVVERRLLDALEAEHLCVEVVVLLSGSHTQRDVVVSLYPNRSVSHDPHPPLVATHVHDTSF